MRDHTHSAISDMISSHEKNSPQITDFFLNFLAVCFTIIELVLKGCSLLLRKMAALTFRLVIVTIFAVILIAAYLVVSALYLSTQPFFGGNIS